MDKNLTKFWGYAILIKDKIDFLEACGGRGPTQGQIGK